MKNALGQPQNIVLLGGRSEIGLAIVRQLLSDSTANVVLAGRPGAATGSSTLAAGSFAVHEVAFDARDSASHVDAIGSMAATVGDLDVVVLAFGILGEQSAFEQDPASAADVAMVNFGGAMSVSLAVLQQFRRQGHGHLVILSSVAGERTRKANYVYGATKAGLDAFAQGLGDALAGTPYRVTIVRPGFVHSAMTAGRDPAPFATDPDTVASATVSAMRSGRRIVWVPGVLRWVFMVLRHLPTALWRRLPLG